MAVKTLQTESRVLSASDQLMKTLQEAGVDCIFANLGSDHPAIIESWATFRAQGEKLPQIIVCPHEMVALSAAHGYAQSTGRLQAVFVHVDVGTQNVGGALHNALRARVPIFMFAGASPVTVDGELAGSRNEFIHYLQDVFDQRGIVRGYTKWNYDLHVGQNIDLVVKRAIQMAASDPCGPVYLMAAREMLEQPAIAPEGVVRELPPLEPAAASPRLIAELASALATAEHPLILTSYLGRNHDAVGELVRLSDQLAIPVMEAGPFYMNFPSNHPMHLGYEDYVQHNPYLEQADVVLVIDSDIPWMTQNSKMADGAKLYWIDADPLKETIPLWYYSGQRAVRADSCVALRQLNEALAKVPLRTNAIEQRRSAVTAESAHLREMWASQEEMPQDGIITPEFLTRVVRETIDDDTLIVNETISNYSVAWRHLQRTKPGSFFASGASSLGWHGGAAVGVKLAHPDKPVVALTGDGSYVFSVPSAVHMVAQKYETPFLTVIYNNGGWKSPKLSTLAVHPNGNARTHDDFHVDFFPESHLEQIAGAIGDTHAVKVSEPNELRSALKFAFEQVKQGRSAVVNVILERI